MLDEEAEADERMTELAEQELNTGVWKAERAE
jgi:hypothetical protein